MKNEEVIQIDWELGTEYPELVGKPKVLDYDYGLNEKEICVLDFVPASELSADLKFEELTCPSTLDLGDPQLTDVKLEKDEPCAAAAAIEANIPTPDPLSLLKWRTFISAAYFHPNILVHGDVACLKELFYLLGEDINFGSVNVMIDLGQTVKDYKPAAYLRPLLPSNQKPLIFNFAHVKDFFIDMELKVCVVTKYGIAEYMKRAVTEMVTFIVEYPEALYLEIYGFILDFLLKFGVQSDMIIDAVMRTQTRRRKLQRPASVLILKKANSLGKGKKEFLQQQLESPELKYHPVVPIIEEPPPVRTLRTLRNRKTGGVDPDKTSKGDIRLEATPQMPPQMPSSFGSPQQTYTYFPTENNTYIAPVFAVKRKLFVEDTQEATKASKTPKSDAPAPTTSTLSTKDYRHAINESSLGSRKKRFYFRRDSSTIEKPFTCNICSDRSFAYKGNLVLHMKKKHQSQASGKQRPIRQENRIPAFSCPICLQGYASKYKCKAHIERLHPENADWPAICNEEALSQHKTIKKGPRKGAKASTGTAVRRSTRQSLVPLSQTQNSSCQSGKPSHVCHNLTPDIRASTSLPSRKHQLQFPIRSGPPIRLKNYTRTRQHFRAAVK